MSCIPCLDGDDEYEGDEVEKTNWFGSMKNACIVMIVGIILVPGSVVLLGWNEKNAVCAARALDEGLGVVREVQCQESNQSKFESDLVFFSCPLTESSFTEYNPSKDFRGGELLGDAFVAKGTCMKQDVEMYQCVETKTTKTTNNTSGGKTTVTTYHYNKGWGNQLMNESSFCQESSCKTKRNQACGTTINPTTYPLTPGSQIQHANGIEAGVWRLSDNLIGKIPCDKAVPGDPAAFTPAATETPQQPPGALQVTNTKLAGDTLQTCWTKTEVGCMKINYSTHSATDVSVMSKYSSGGNLGAWVASDSWLCSGYTLNELRLGVMTVDELGLQLEKENTGLVWALRFIGFLLVWGGMFMVCAPITTCPDMIPCIGPIIGDIIGWILACATCLLATTLSLIVIAIAWVVVRPIVGGVLLGVAVLCIVGFVLIRIYWNRQKEE